MKAIQITKYVKGPHELKVSTLPEPIPKPDEYLIEVHAAGANFFDILQIQGKYQNQPPFPWIAGAEYAGIVLAVPTSPAASPPKYPVGTRVFGAGQGGYATRLCTPESGLLAVPAGWSFADAAGLFVTVPTSYAGLVTRAGLQRGEWVLVHAAAGGVGLAAVQIAKAFGATVIATAGSAAKLAIAREFGADHVLSYRDSSWPEKVKKLSPGGRGVNVVYDPVGLVDKSTKCIAWGGRIVVVGFVGGAIEKVATNKVLLKNISLVGVHWGQFHLHEPEAIPGIWEGIMKLIAEGKFRPPEFTDREFVGLESVGDALTALGKRETWGKVIVKIPQEGKSKI